jgi:predicted Rdx family selenoprotein
VSAEIRDRTGLEAELTAGGNGIFDVRLNGELLFSRHETGRFPKAGEIAAHF